MQATGNQKSVFVFTTLIVLLTVRSSNVDIYGRQPEQPEIRTISKEVQPVVHVPSDTGGGSSGDSLDLERWRSQESAAPPQETEHQQLSIHTERNQLDAGSARVHPAGNPDSCIVHISHLESIMERPQSTSTLVDGTSHREESRRTLAIDREEAMHVVSDAHGGTSTCRWVRESYYYVDLEGETSSEAGTSRIHSGNRPIVTGGAGIREIREQMTERLNHNIPLTQPVRMTERLNHNIPLTQMVQMTERLNHNIPLTQLVQMTERLRLQENPLESTNQLNPVNMLPGTSGGAQLPLASFHRRQITTPGNSQTNRGTPSEDGPGVNRNTNRDFGLFFFGSQLQGVRRADFTREQLLPISCYIACAVAILMIATLLLSGKAWSHRQRNTMVAVAFLLLFLQCFIIKPLYLA